MTLTVPPVTLMSHLAATMTDIESQEATTVQVVAPADLAPGYRFNVDSNGTNYLVEVVSNKIPRLRADSVSLSFRTSFFYFSAASR